MVSNIFLALLLSLTLISMTQAGENAPRDANAAVVKRADDESVSSLQVLVQQQAAVIQTLQARQDALQNRIASAESRNVVLENKLTSVESKVAAQSRAVAFTVRFKADDGANGLPVGPQATLRFDDLILNTGAAYDPQTGFFTAPAAGIYVFFLTHMGAGAHGESFLSLVKHGHILDLVYSKDHEDQGSSQVTVKLGAGEQVWVQNHLGSAVRGGWWTVFSGYLLRAD